MTHKYCIKFNEICMYTVFLWLSPLPVHYNNHYFFHGVHFVSYNVIMMQMSWCWNKFYYLYLVSSFFEIYIFFWKLNKRKLLMQISRTRVFKIAKKTQKKQKWTHFPLYVFKICKINIPDVGLILFDIRCLICMYTVSISYVSRANHDWAWSDGHLLGVRFTQIFITKFSQGAWLMLSLFSSTDHYLRCRTISWCDQQTWKQNA